VGWIMGGYQMLKGAHYLSDTLVTMLLAWIIHLLLRRLLLRDRGATADRLSAWWKSIRGVSKPGEHRPSN
jgi:membrane-associated PAP2 superfamily phosphatase